MTRLTGTAQAVSCVSGHGAAALTSVDATDIGAVIASIYGSAIMGSCWFVSPQVYGSVFARLAATSGGLVTQLNSDGTIRAANYLGFPVLFSSAAPSVAGDGKPLLFFGNAAQSSMLVQRRATIIAASWQAAKGSTFENDELLLRATMRIGVTVHDTAPIAMLLGKS